MATSGVNAKAPWDEAFHFVLLLSGKVNSCTWVRDRQYLWIWAMVEPIPTITTTNPALPARRRAMADPPDTVRMGSRSMGSSVESMLTSGNQEWVTLEQPSSLHNPHSHLLSTSMSLQSIPSSSSSRSLPRPPPCSTAPVFPHPSPHHMKVSEFSEAQLDPVPPLLQSLP